MPLTGMHHFSIRTEDVERSTRFYVDVLGFTDGPRPPFDFPGAWLYQGDSANPRNAIVHIIGIDASSPQGLRAYMGDRDARRELGTGPFDHMAFGGENLPEVRAQLDAHRVEFVERMVPMLGLHQVFFKDPNGIMIELNFPATEAA